MSLGHKGQEIRQGCSDHRRFPLPPPTPRSNIDAAAIHHHPRGAFTILSPDRSGSASNHAQIFIQRVFLPRGKISWTRNFFARITNLSLQFLLTPIILHRGEELFINKSFIFSNEDIIDSFHLVFNSWEWKFFPISICRSRLVCPGFFEDDKKRKKRRGYIRRRGRNSRPSRRTKSGRTADKSLSILNWIWYFNSSCTLYTRGEIGRGERISERIEEKFTLSRSGRKV